MFVLLGDIKSEIPHNGHEAEPVKLGVKKVHNKLKRKAIKTHDRHIVSDGTSHVGREVAVELPLEDSMKRMVRRARAANSGYPRHPTTREELVIPPDFCTTLRGGTPFLINDDG